MLHSPQRNVFIRDVDGMGEGLFAKRDFRAGEQVAYYAGFMYNVTEQPVFPDNLTDEEA